MRGLFQGLLILVALLASVNQGWCEDADQGLKIFGVRGGISATSRSEFFHLYQAFASYGLPWSVRGESGWGIAMRLNGAAGALHAAHETGAIVGLGPGIVFDKAGGKGVALDLGGDLNGTSWDRFGSVYLNGHLLFDGHVGITYRFDCGPGIGYRFWHLSNGGLNGKWNTGADLHILELSWNL